MGWAETRDRLLASDRFHRWAARFPLTRPFARREARALFDLCAGFVYSQVLSACVRLDVFERLADGPKPLGDLATAFEMPQDRAEILLDAAVSLRLLERRKAGYGLGPLGAALRGAPGVSAMVRHHDALYADLADPVGLLRGERDATALNAFWAYADDRTAMAEETVADYSQLMAASQPMVAQEVLDAYSVTRHRRLLDIGGGEGVFAAAALRRAPDLRATIFDLPEVARRANARLEGEGLRDRAEAVGGDFFADTPPAGADLVSLIRVIYDHADANAMRILRAARAALAPGGSLILAEPMAGARGAEPMGEAYFGLYLLAMKGGRSRRPDTLIEMLRDAGFRDARRLRTNRPLLSGLIVARA